MATSLGALSFMPLAAPKPCCQPGCNALAHDGTSRCTAYKVKRDSFGHRQYHHLYNKAAWRNAREAQLSAHPLCRMHLQLGQAVVATVADHIVPHKGDLERFLDRSNLQSLCKRCHDSHKHAQEHNADGILRGAGVTGAPLDLAHPWHRPAVRAQQ